jgi:hypothetical protein
VERFIDVPSVFGLVMIEIVVYNVLVLFMLF